MSAQFLNLLDRHSNFDESRAKCGAQIIEAQAVDARKPDGSQQCALKGASDTEQKTAVWKLAAEALKLSRPPFRHGAP
jgi:hypothetical protein